MNGLTVNDQTKAIEKILTGLSELGVSATFSSQELDLANPETIPESAVLQNRNRANKASIEQMHSIAANPDYDRLGVDKNFGSGAPVVAYGKIPKTQMGKIAKAVMPDGTKYDIQYAVVEASTVATSNDVNGSTNEEYFTNDSGIIRAIAGNGRVAGLTHAYERGTAESYRQAMMKDCANFGVASSIIEKMTAPILVRVMQPKDVSSDIGDRSNRQTGLTMNAVEQANNDKHRINFSRVKSYEDGSLTIESISEFIAQMPREERANLVDSEGTPTKQAEDRANAAVFAKAYASDELTRLKTQALNPDAKTIINALGLAAASMSKLEGLPDGYDIRPLVSMAANKAVQAVKRGERLEETSRQMDFLGDPEDNEAISEILRVFAENRRSSKAISEKLIRLAETVHHQAIMSASSNDQGALDLGSAPLSRNEVVRAGLADPSQVSLFDSVAANKPESGMSRIAMNLWATRGGKAMRWLLSGEGDRPNAFFDSVSFVAYR